MPETSDETHSAVIGPRELLWSAVGFEGAMLAVAAALVWWTGVRPGLTTSWRGASSGVAVGVVMASAAIVIAESRWRIFERSRRDFEMVLELFRDAAIRDLAIVSLLAGVCEEALFRGFLQTWLAGFVNPHVALGAAALLFGLAHPISRVYVIFVTAFGLTLGYLYLLTGELVSVVVAHGLYDFLALVYGVRFFTPEAVADAKDQLPGDD